MTCNLSLRNFDTKRSRLGLDPALIVEALRGDTS